MKSSTISLALSLIALSASQALASPLDDHKLNSRQTTSGSGSGSGFQVDTTPTCTSEPEGFMTMSDARSCLAEIAAKGSEKVTVKAPGGVICERSSGRFWVGIGGDEEQGAAASDIAAAGKLILDTCNFKGISGVPAEMEMTGGGAYVATNGKMYAMFSRDEQDD